MPRKCCVPECKSNYDGQQEKVSAFSFPSDELRKKLWLSKIPRADFVPTKHSVVCAKHFTDSFIVRVDSVTRPDGSVLSVERQVPKLTDDAFPSLFPNCPSYMSSEPPTKRRRPDERREEAVKRDESVYQQWKEADKIKDFTDFTQNINKHVGEKWFSKLIEGVNKKFYSFYSIADSSDSQHSDSAPALQSAIRVFDDMQVQVFTGKAGKYFSIFIPNK
jgi:hypothetical protein